MRSSVSYILSSTTCEPNMSHPDYEQYSHDHAAFLVLVKHIDSQLKPKIFNKFYERISKINNVKITDSAGQVRNIFIRYIKDYPVENNDWGDFQTHRRLLGLISLGKYDNQIELNEICRVHESFKVKYSSTLFDTRCILFGPVKETESPIDHSSSSEDNSSSVSESRECEMKESTEKEKLVEKFTTPSNFKTRALFYHESSLCSDLETQLVEFINSLFWVLESKRLERSKEKLERVSLLFAPFEKKDFVGLDMESRNNKKRCSGRMTKHLGDLCLQAGLISECLTYYNNAAEMLKSVNDWLWLGAAYEGLCAASALVLYPHIQRGASPLHRNTSLQEGSPKKMSVPSVSSPTDVFPYKKNMVNLLPAEDIPKRYKDAIIHYSKYQNAGIIETEACFKAGRIAVALNQALQAASFLQNIVYINLSLSEYEKIQRFETLAELYTDVGFQRKAAFCQRLAATRYVSPQNPTPNWAQCYSLMLKSLPGHKLTLDPVEVCNNNQGWPALQIQLLQELVVAAKRMNHSALATRHMTFLLQTMWKHLSLMEQKEYCVQLQSLAAQCEGSPVPLVLENGVVIPPANLTNIPVCEAFTVRSLPPHLQPRLLKVPKQDLGPFLFTPIHFGSLERPPSGPQTKLKFQWVEGDLCNVSIKLVNPLPFELKVSDMRLLAAGIVFESIPETVVLPPDATTMVNLSGTPKESGELELQGYSTHALGVKSNCRLRHIGWVLPHYNVDVVPALPILQVQTSLPQSASFSSFTDFDSVVTSASLSLYHGEFNECTLTLTNTGHHPVEFLEISLQSVLDTQVQDEMFAWSQDSLKSQLPLAPGASASIAVNIYAAASFIASSNTISGVQDLTSGVYGSSLVGSGMSNSMGPSSLPSQLNSPSHSLHGRRTDLTSSFRSSNSGHSSSGWRSPGALVIPQNTAASSVAEGQLQLKYSGGPGLEAEYGRTCCVFVTLEMIPSMQITNWDVLPAETFTHFYLVLDVVNMTSQEMELEYSEDKKMLVEGHDSCRIPVPIERCPLSKMAELYCQEISSEGTTSDLDIERVCCEHIVKQVNLQWHLLATDTRGRASLKGITLSSSMLDIVRMSPLLWIININGEAVKPLEDINCEAGDCLELSISITNSLDCPLKNLTLSVQFYQDYENGTLNYKLDSRLVVVGTNKLCLSNLDPHQTEKHECNVVFFTPGKYKMDVQCCSSSEKLVNTERHVWRFTPPINITAS